MNESTNILDGGCACGAMRYRLLARPMFIHCCHCCWCQRESGSAFALNALIEADRVQLVKGTPTRISTPSHSGKGQDYYRCADCQVALWSHYAGAGDKICFIRVGTLDHARELQPDVHIFTESKQPWVVIPDDMPSFSAFYEYRKQWPEDSLARAARLKETKV